MKETQKHYKLQIKSSAPVFIGNGKEINKKEYFLRGRKICVIDFAKLYGILGKKNKAGQLEELFLGRYGGTLDDFIKREKISDQEIQTALRYQIPLGNNEIDRRAQIMEFIKDPEGHPYIPGSSIKGMLRTAIAIHKLATDKNIRDRAAQNLKTGMGMRAKRTTFLRKENEDIEAAIFRTLAREKTRKTDAVNDTLSGLIIGDSAPLSLENLMIARKIDRTPNKIENKLPIYRESLASDTHIEADLTIYPALCPYGKDEILQAIKTAAEHYNRAFLQHFQSVSDIKENQTFLGGGAGFLTKTIYTALLEDNERPKTIAEIFDKTGVPRNHRHHMDATEYKVSPHMAKLTIIPGKYAKMGLCDIAITEG